MLVRSGLPNKSRPRSSFIARVLRGPISLTSLRMNQLRASGGISAAHGLLRPEAVRALAVGDQLCDKSSGASAKSRYTGPISRSISFQSSSGQEWNTRFIEAG